MPDSGPRSPGTVVNDTAFGSEPWLELDGAKVGADTIYAAPNPTSTGVTITSNYIKATNFGFNIPAGAVITGIKVEVERAERQSSTDAKDARVRLVDEIGTVRTHDKADTVTEWPVQPAFAYRTYGGSTDLWGEASDFWTPEKINDPDFGVVLAATFVSGGTDEIRVDHIRITVTYVEVFPHVVARNNGEHLAVVTNHVLPLPENVAIGDRVVVGFAFDEQQVTTWPTGWNQIAIKNDDGSFSLEAQYRDVDGTEPWFGSANPTITVTVPTTAELSESRSWRITGHDPTTAPAAATLGGSDANPNSPSLDPPWGTESALWLSLVVTSNGDRTFSGFPTNYNNTFWDGTSGGAGGVVLGVAERQLNAASEDPGQFTIDLSAGWSAITIAIRGEQVGAALQTITLGGIDSSSSMGALTVSVGATPVLLDGIGPTSSMGALALSLPGATMWWNATTEAWQLTEVFNDGAVAEAVFPPDSWPIGDHEWSAATRDALGMQSPYSDSNTVHINVSQQLNLSGIGPTSQLGDLTIGLGATPILLPGIGPTSEMGPLLTAYIINLPGIGPTSGMGPLVVVPGASSIFLPGIGPTSEMGSLLITTTTPTGLTSVTVPPQWFVVIAELDGTEIDEVPAKNLQVSWAYNEPGGCGFTLPLEHAKSTRDLLDPGRREIHVYRESTRVWGGYLWFVGATSSDPSIRIAGEGYLSRLARRHIDEDKIFEEVDQLDIAWNLINWMQNKVIAGVSGDLGITRFNPLEASGVLRSVKFRRWERQIMLDVLQGFSELDGGFDFDISPNKEWKTFHPRKGTETDHVLELGRNVQNISYDIDAENTISELSGLGAGDRANRCIAVVSDALVLDEFGILQASEDFSDIKRFDTLAAKTNQQFKLRKKARAQPQLVIYPANPDLSEYTIGDRMRVVAKKGYIDIDKVLTLVTNQVQLNDEGREVPQMYFDEVLV